MAGFSNISGDESIVYADNASFDGTERGGKMTTNGQLWIGATASPHVRLGSLASAGATIVITTGAGTIDLATSGSKVGNTITGDTGGALSPTAGNWNILGGVNGPNMVTTGSGSTLTLRSDILTYVQPGAYPYTVLALDYYIAVDSASARTINLPNAPTTGKSYVIKDRVGSAATNNITVTTPGGAVLIDGSTTFVISTNYGSINVVFNGTKYEIF